jgi:hypothetical protein
MLVDKIMSLKSGNQQIPCLHIDHDPPWMSPNIWAEIVDFYRPLNAPIIFEFGTGASTLHHVQELLSMRAGQYIGIENNQDWFWTVAASVIILLTQRGEGLRIRMDSVDSSEVSKSGNLDLEVQTANIKILLRLRDSLEKYLQAFDRDCDVVIVDGISRKHCIHHILQTSKLREAGLLMLMEAGRGLPDWWEGKLFGDDDYSPQLETLIELGGIIIDGNGVDNWPCCTRRSPRPISYFSPLEACKLIMPGPGTKRGALAADIGTRP